RPRPTGGSVGLPHRSRAKSRAAGRSRRCRSTNGRRVPRCVHARSTAPPPASRAPEISRAAAAARFRSTCSAGGRTGPRSFLRFAAPRTQPSQRAAAVPGAPVVIVGGLGRPHRGAWNTEMPPGGAVDKPWRKRRGGDRAAVAPAGVLHIGELRVDQLVVFGAE